MNLDIAAELCKKFEGFRSKPYLCPANVATIGFGSTYYGDGRKVVLTDLPMSEKEAHDLLMIELHHTYLPGTLRLCPNLAAHEKRLNAIVDFCYNLGVGRLQSSTLRRKVVAEDWEGAKEELLKWNKGGGRVLAGLDKRRRAECALM
jgi:lysozyme